MEITEEEYHVWRKVDAAIRNRSVKTEIPDMDLSTEDQYRYGKLIFIDELYPC